MKPGVAQRKSLRLMRRFRIVLKRTLDKHNLQSLRAHYLLTYPRTPTDEAGQ